MGVQTYAWEHRLLAKANEAFSSPILNTRLKTDHDMVDNAYQYCAAITRNSSRTFYLSANLLPKAKRAAVLALYAFCRTTDDLVDKTQGVVDSDKVFANWRLRLTSGYPTSHDPVPLAWTDTQTHYRIPRGYADQLIDGIAGDLVQNRYTTFAERAEYCYGVASTVGRLLRDRTWTISPAQSLTIFVPLIHMPIEEALFFLVTNTLIIRGMVLFLDRSHLRARVGQILTIGKRQRVSQKTSQRKYTG